MSNTYDSMAGALSSGAALGNTALVSSLIACTVWPESLLAPIPAAKSGFLLAQLEKRVPVKSVNLPIHGAVDVGITNVPARLFLIRTDTGKMLQACSRIHESGSAGLRYLEDLNEQYYSVSPTTWESNDQAAFSKQLLDYRNSVQNTYCLAWETALLTSIVATLRFVQLAIAAVIAGILAAMAIAYWALVFIPFTTAAAQAIRTAGMAIARALPTIIRVMDEIMVKVGWVHSGLLGVRTMQAAISDSMRLDGGEGFRILGGAAVEVLGDLMKKLTKGQVNVLSGF